MGRQSAWGGGALLLALAVAAAVAVRPVTAASGPVLDRRQERLIVRGDDYVATIDLAAGGRIASYQVGGLQVTQLCDSGRGGLFVEQHTAGVRYGVVEQEASAGGLRVQLAASAGPLRVVKEYQFPPAGSRLTCRLAFENRSRFALGGGEAPALRHLVWPAGREAAGRELFCLNRGRGAEVLSPEIFLARVPAPAGGPLQWLAAADPTARRAAGFALLRGHVRPIAPRRCPGGGTSFGWRHAALPAGQRMEAEVLFCLLEGFTAVSELNGRFAAESLPAKGTGGARVRLRLLPLDSSVDEVSVVTRTYGAQGAELGPSEALVFSELGPPQAIERQTRWSGDPSALRWLVHEVYAGGDRLSRFAVPVGEATDLPPVGGGPPPEAPLQGLDDYTPVPAGARLQAGRRERELGFQLWQFDGAPATDPLERLELTLAREERLTRFLGIRALRDVEVRLALGASGASGAAPIPPAGLYLWQVMEPPDGPAYLTPLSGLTLAPGQTRWLAVTVDGRELQPGRSEGLLVAEAGGRAMRIPLSARVLPLAPAPSTAFGLWYLAPAGQSPLQSGSGAALERYGVGALTVPVGESLSPLDYREIGAQAARRGLDRLAFIRAGGVLPPTSSYPGRPLLPCPDPGWLLRVGGASARSLEGALEAGYRPAVLCESLDALSAEMVPGRGHCGAYLVRDGVPPAVVPAMVRSGALEGDEEIWLTLDLRGADWKRAAVSVRSAFWAAAWQGLAGAAVRCAPPSRQMERQLAIWHILRDARKEVALWRHVRRAVRAAGAQSEPRRLARVETVVGPGRGSLLRLREEPAPGRTLHRVGGAAPGGPRLRDFYAARRQVLDLRRPRPPRGRNLYWRGIPAVAEGRANWAFIAEGGDAWSFASQLRDAVAARVAYKPPISHGFPSGQADGPALVWAVVANSGRLDWPEPLRSAIEAAPDVPLLTVQLQDGPLVAVLRTGPQADHILRTFTSRPWLYTAARHVQ